MNKKLMSKAYSFFVLALSFLIPYLVMLNVYKYLGFYPYGTKSLLTYDMNEQYVHFYESLRQIVSGESSIFFSWSKNMGTNNIGLFAYYLSSPLSFIILLFKQENIQLAIFFLTLIKISLCGLTSYLYLSYTFNCKKTPMLIFSTAYALMSYNIRYSICLMWIDGIIWMPLILLGAEKIFRKEKPYVFIISLCVLFISNFYISYMVCIFCALFIIYRYLTTNADIYFVDFIKTVGKFLIYALISIGMALWLLLPVFFNLADGKIASGSLMPQKFTNFPLYWYPMAYLPNKYTTICLAWNAIPALYCGIAIYILCFIFFIIKSIKMKEKIIILLFFIFLHCSFYFTKLDLVWHGFIYPVGYPYRYSFVFDFLSIFIACKLSVNIKNELLAKPYESVQTVKKSLTLTVKPARIISAFIAIVVLPLTCFDLYNNSKAMITGLDEEFKYYDVSSYSDFRNENLYMIEYVKDTDNSFYRMESRHPFTRNDSIGLGYKGISHFSSVYNKRLLDFIKQVGFFQFLMSNLYIDSTPLMDSIFNIKYVISKDEMPSGYNKIITSGDAAMYENTYVLPIGFMVDKAVRDINMEGYNFFKKQNEILNGFCGDTASYFKKIEDVKGGGGGHNINYSFTADNDFPVYLAIQAFVKNPDGEIMSWANGPLYVNDQLRMEEYYLNNYNHVAYIGQFEPGTKLDISIDLEWGTVEVLEGYIYYLDTDELSKTVQKLREGGLYNISYKNSHIKAEVDAAQDGVMFTSIPYDEGFTVKVDGKKVRYTSFNDTFLIFEVNEGHHYIEISFIPKGFIAGLSVSIISLGLFIWLLNRKP